MPGVKPETRSAIRLAVPRALQLACMATKDGDERAASPDTRHSRMPYRSRSPSSARHQAFHALVSIFIEDICAHGSAIPIRGRITLPNSDHVDHQSRDDCCHVHHAS